MPGRAWDSRFDRAHAHKQESSDVIDRSIMRGQTSRDAPLLLLLLLPLLGADAFTGAGGGNRAPDGATSAVGPPAATGVATTWRRGASEGTTATFGLLLVAGVAVGVAVVDADADGAVADADAALWRLLCSRSRP